MKASKFITPAQVAKERLDKCKSCKFYNDEFGTCGTLVSGDTVKYYGKEYKLCGCVMAVKTKLSFASCPVGKWSSIGKLPQFVEEIRELVDRLTPAPPFKTVSWTSQDRRDVFELTKRITAANWGDAEANKMQMPTCCHADMLEDLRRLLKHYDKC